LRAKPSNPGAARTTLDRLGTRHYETIEPHTAARHCERSEAIQGPARTALDRFVAALLAMTGVAALLAMTGVAALLAMTGAAPLLAMTRQVTGASK